MSASSSSGVSRLFPAGQLVFSANGSGDGNSGSAGAARAAQPSSNFLTQLFLVKRSELDKEFSALSNRKDQHVATSQTTSNAVKACETNLHQLQHELALLEQQFTAATLAFNNKKDAYTARLTAEMNIDNQLIGEIEAFLKTEMPWDGKVSNDNKKSVAEGNAKKLESEDKQVKAAEAHCEQLKRNIANCQDSIAKVEKKLAAEKQAHARNLGQLEIHEQGLSEITNLSNVYESAQRGVEQIAGDVSSAILGNISDFLKDKFQEWNAKLGSFGTDNAVLMKSYADSIKLNKKQIKILEASANPQVEVFKTTLKSMEEAFDKLNSQKTELVNSCSEINRAIQIIDAKRSKLPKQTQAESSKKQQDASDAQPVGSKRKLGDVIEILSDDDSTDTASDGNEDVQKSSAKASGVAAASSSSSSKAGVRGRVKKAAAQAIQTKRRRTESAAGEGTSEGIAAELERKQAGAWRDYAGYRSGYDSDNNNKKALDSASKNPSCPTLLKIPTFPAATLHGYIQNQPNLSEAQLDAYINEKKAQGQEVQDSVIENWSLTMVLAHYASFETFAHFISTHRPLLQLSACKKYLLSTAVTGGANLLHLIAGNANFNRPEVQPKLKAFLEQLKNIGFDPNTKVSSTKYILDSSAKLRYDTALHVAVYLRHDLIANTLIQAGAYPLAKDFVNDTPLHIAVRFQGKDDDEDLQEKVVRKLLSFRQVSESGKDIENSAGQTPNSIVRGSVGNFLARISGTKKSSVLTQQLRRNLKDALVELAKTPEQLRLK